MMMMMEFLQELLLTAFISIVFAFFLAKLISLSSSPDLDQDLAQRLISAVDPSQFSLSAEKFETQSIHELKCYGAVSIKDEEEEMKFHGREAAIVRERDGVELEERLVQDAEFCGELVKRGIGFEIALDSDRIEVKEVSGEGNGAEFLKSGDLDVEEAKDEKKSERDGEFDVGLVKDEFEAKEEEKSERDGEFDVGSVEEASRSDLNEFEAKEGKKADGNDEIDVESVKEAAKEEKRSEIDGEFDLGLVKKEVGFTRSNVADKGIAIEKSDLFDDEDDEWEGIERSELEKRFAAMASRVALGGGDILSKLGSDVEMQLYGLHKVATEGPCYEQQPSMLKVSARAKCLLKIVQGRELLCLSDGEHWLRCARHAWQRLGNMNPEVAMEQYINLLSDSIPGWIGEKPDDNNIKKEVDDSSTEPECASKPSDLSSSPHHLTSSIYERIPEIHHCVPKGDDFGGPKFLEQEHSVNDAST
ncbi:trichohyalin isoform X3 [Cinnamomum micranthum f. kanehirae]|uniref:Trichohyalin isoform X3 n=1 Tax=Cinnamomum micranthum f. kanehirae TaxID=337451 RepID=A0A443PNK6_9MAGN|nr:trichohyalin isoform X3 [Cinnamomum micranthum f. kanehirae]